MNCPRCGQKIPTTSFGRCPKCGQPLYPPRTEPARVTKVMPQPDWTQSATPVDAEGWPDLTATPVTQPESDQLDPATARVRLPGAGRSRKLPSIVLAAAVVLIVISGGTLLLAARIQPHKTRSTAETGTNTAQKAGVTATGEPKTATTAATSAATSAPTNVPTQPGGEATPTQTPTVTASPTPQLVTIFSDPLSENTNGWPVESGCSFAAGGYQVNGGAECLAPVTASDTVNISVQMTSMGWTFEGAGIGFRIPSGQPDQQYSFYIYADGSGGTCMAQDQATNKTYFDNTSCSAVQKGADAVNTLAINQSGAEMDFYVNGTLVGSADDATLSGGGVSLEAHKYGPPVVFNNFVLTTWQ